MTLHSSRRRAVLQAGGAIAATSAAAWLAGCGALASAEPADAIDASRARVIERDDLAVHFRAAGLQSGCFALYDPGAATLTVVNRAGAQRRQIPASTYKIPNSLIALETGAVRDIDEVLPYGGRPQRFKHWEQDMDLRDAIRVSNVPVYQGVARRIGLARMNEWVARLHYGNQTLGTVEDRFWLDGPLEISAVEQTTFLARLGRAALPMSTRTQERVARIALLERTPTHALHGKTGWVFDQRQSLGWWVGWVRRSDGVVRSFALNVALRDDAEAAQRVPVGRRLLAALDAMPAPA